MPLRASFTAAIFNWWQSQRAWGWRRVLCLGGQWGGGPAGVGSRRLTKLPYYLYVSVPICILVRKGLRSLSGDACRVYYQQAGELARVL